MKDRFGVDITVGAIVHWRYMNVVDRNRRFLPRGVGRVIEISKDDFYTERDAAVVLRLEEDPSESTIKKLSQDIIRFTPEEEVLWKLENA